jgi:hypothetical protein
MKSCSHQRLHARAHIYYHSKVLNALNDDAGVEIQRELLDFDNFYQLTQQLLRLLI